MGDHGSFTAVYRYPNHAGVREALCDLTGMLVHVVYQIYHIVVWNARSRKSCKQNAFLVNNSTGVPADGFIYIKLPCTHTWKYCTRFDGLLEHVHLQNK